MSIEPPVTAGRNGRSRVSADCLMGSGLESTGPARYAFSNFIDGGTLLRGFTIATAVATAVVCQTTLAQAQTPREPPPAWAYPVNPPDFKLPPDDGTIQRVPGSTAGYTLTQLRNPFAPPDWHPADRPPMPQIVAQGRKPDVWACGYCHRADGPGGPENANLTGLPVAYMIQQLVDFKSGARRSSVMSRGSVTLKVKISAALDEAEMSAAAAYFASIKARSMVSVVETDTAPKTFVMMWHLAAHKGAEKEPIGRRIIEVPEDLELFENRFTGARFIAYAPVGSIEQGKVLATTGGDGKTVPCTTCHGPGLKGLGAIPGIAGRSPSYIVRQLYDFKNGVRAGADSALMKGSVENLSVDDMMVLAAYAASLAP